MVSLTMNCWLYPEYALLKIKDYVVKVNNSYRIFFCECVLGLKLPFYVISTIIFEVFFFFFGSRS